MKTTGAIRQIMPLCLSLIIGMHFFASCQTADPERDGFVKLDNVQENASYITMPFVGTEWKLIGFADEANSEVKLALPSPRDTPVARYTVVFKEDGKISGYTSTNFASGVYSLESNIVSIDNFHNATEVAELLDGTLFIESMNKVFSFLISSKGLELHYEEGKYLLFQPVE
jgi:heat shock protein HslJ